MLDSNFILDAMNGVHEKQVIMAGEMLGYIEKKGTVHLHRKLWSTILIAAILISLLGITAYALGVFQMWVEEMKPDADKAGHWVLQDSAGNDISYWLYDKFHTGISLNFDSETAPHRVEFHPNWLPEEPKDTYFTPTSDGWYDYLMDDRGDETEWYPAEGVYDAGIPYLITTYYAYKDHVLVLEGDCQIVKRENWDSLEVLEVTCAKDIYEWRDTPQERHLTSYENYVFMFSPDEGYLINIGGTADMETLEHIARDLDVRVTEEIVDYGPEFYVDLLNIVRG